MKFGKQASSVVAVYAIVTGLYSLLFFGIPFEKSTAAFVSYGFTIFAIICSLYVTYSAFGKDTLVSKVYGYPVFRVGIMYAAIQMVLGFIISLIGIGVEIPMWILLILYLGLLGVMAIGFIAVDNVRDHVEAIDASSQRQTQVIRHFRVDISAITASCDDMALKAQLEKLNEQFRFSDPVSSDSTASIETVLNNMLAELKNLVISGDYANASVAIREISVKLAERNDICKLTKKY